MVVENFCSIVAHFFKSVIIQVGASIFSISHQCELPNEKKRKVSIEVSHTPYRACQPKKARIQGL